MALAWGIQTVILNEVYQEKLSKELWNQFMLSLLCSPRLDVIKRWWTAWKLPHQRRSDGVPPFTCCHLCRHHHPPPLQMWRQEILTTLWAEWGVKDADWSPHCFVFNLYLTVFYNIFLHCYISKYFTEKQSNVIASCPPCLSLTFITFTTYDFC